MDILEERLRASLLYDYYGELLNDNQRKFCEQYFEGDLSLSEIALQEGITRQGVHDKIKRGIKQLELYEERLSLVRKSELMEESIKEIRLLLEKLTDVALKSAVLKKLDLIDGLLS